MTVVETVLGHPTVERLSRRALRGRLRVLAYHRVPDAAAFRAHLEHLAANYHVVSGEQVLDSVRSGRPLASDAVWITFDDGRRDVVQRGMPELTRLGLSATLFVCPGLVESGRPFWWSVVEAALADGPLEFEGRTWTDRKLVTHLKTVADGERRAFVDGLGSPPVDADDVSVSTDEISAWLDAGLEIGNHTWDHPCLDQCPADVQTAQIVDAHEALTALLGRHPLLFAYPNGDFTPVATAALRDAGYEIALNFDHRVARAGEDPLMMSRLRIDSDIGLDRARSIFGGGHSAVFSARNALRARLGR